MPAKKKRPLTKSGTPRKRKGVKLKPTELGPADLLLPANDPALIQISAEIAADGGTVLGTYREPLGGHAQLLAALPIDRVEPTPYQREVSDPHVRRLTLAMDRIGRFLDPIITVRVDGKYYTPNGNHRLTALKELGAKSIVGLVVPDPEVAYRILAMNTEKAHNLREKAIEVAKMYGELASLDRGGGPRSGEDAYATEFEEPQLITLGFGYLKRPRLSGGAYQPALKKVDAFLKKPLATAREERERRADLVLKLDDAVSGAVLRLKERGLVSPYLKTFVVARINPLRFISAAGGDLPSFDELLETMTRRATGMKVEKIRSEDLSRAGGVPDEE